jgi:hypothetical protein
LGSQVNQQGDIQGSVGKNQFFFQDAAGDPEEQDESSEGIEGNDLVEFKKLRCPGKKDEGDDYEYEVKTPDEVFVGPGHGRKFNRNA